MRRCLKSRVVVPVMALAMVVAMVIAMCGLSLAQPAQVTPEAAAAAAKAEDISQIGGNLEPLKLALDQIEASVSREGQTDEALAQNRQSLDPVRDELRDSQDVLGRRLTDIDARLKQLGDAPAANAPPEDASLAAERGRLSQRRGAIDGALKQVRLLNLRADDLAERITDQRRNIFTRQLFNRSASALDPAFWMKAAEATPDGLRGVMYLGQSWWTYALANGGISSMVAAALTLAVFGVIIFAVRRWFKRRGFRPPVLGTRFAKSFFALIALISIALTSSLIASAFVFVLEGFGLMPPRMMDIGLGLIGAVIIAAFGQGVAVGLFAPDEPERRLLAIRDETASLVADHLVWAARILAAIVLINVIQRAVVAPVSLTVATSAIFVAIIGALLGHFLYRLARIDEQDDDEISRAGWLRAAGWILAASMVIALATGFIGFAAFLAGRFLVALGVIGALYILVIFTDALFTEVLTASTPRGRQVANFFGVKPRSIELIGTVLSAAIRVLLVLVVLLPLLGPWGIFAADFVSVVRDATFGIRIGDATISVRSILGAFAILLIGILATRAVQSWLNTRFLPRTTMEPGLQNSISTIFGYLGVIAAIAWAMAELGVDFQKITLVAGALSIGIGFGLQSVVSNFVSGLILLAERPIRVGDIINVKGEEGTVRRIHVRATEIETGDRASVIIPNSELITQVVKNRTHTDTFARVAVVIGVAYDSDVTQVRDILLDIARHHPNVMPSPAPSALLTGFGDSAIQFELGWVVRNIGEGASVKSDICFAILEQFRAKGIVIPYPQREVSVRGLTALQPKEAGQP